VLRGAGDPDFEATGLLPAGIHHADWAEIVARFGISSRRKWLLEGLLDALTMLRTAGCQVVYIDGSFVTTKADPEDYDALWDAAGVKARSSTGFAGLHCRTFKTKSEISRRVFPRYKRLRTSWA